MARYDFDGEGDAPFDQGASRDEAGILFRDRRAAREDGLRIVSEPAMAPGFPGRRRDMAAVAQDREIARLPFSSASRL